MEIEELISYLLTPAAQVLLIVALAEVVKRAELFDKKYIPIVDLGLGLLSGVIVYGLILGHGALVSIVVGVALGLSACGLFSGVKNISE